VAESINLFRARPDGHVVSIHDEVDAARRLARVRRIGYFRGMNVRFVSEEEFIRKNGGRPGQDEETRKRRA